MKRRKPDNHIISYPLLSRHSHSVTTGVFTLFVLFYIRPTYRTCLDTRHGQPCIDTEPMKLMLTWEHPGGWSLQSRQAHCTFVCFSSTRCCNSHCWWTCLCNAVPEETSEQWPDHVHAILSDAFNWWLCFGFGMRWLIICSFKLEGKEVFLGNILWHSVPSE